MKTRKQPTDVYKNSEFRDLISSNNFYTVAAIALVLGLASAMGFIQEPRKLKSVVDTLSSKVSVSQPDNQMMLYKVFKRDRYGLSATPESYGTNPQRFYSGLVHSEVSGFGHFYQTGLLANSASLLSGKERKFNLFKAGSSIMNGYALNGRKISTEAVSPVAFGYDITSRNFWNDFNESTRSHRGSGSVSGYVSSNLNSVVGSHYEALLQSGRYQLESGLHAQGTDKSGVSGETYSITGSIRQKHSI